MERNSLKDPLNCESQSNGEFSWPRTSFKCSFCRREFQCAQALGGHMNAHKKDKAALIRQSPPNPNPSPNPKLLSSLSSLPPLISPRPLLSSTSPSSTSSSEVKKRGLLVGNLLDGFKKEDLKKARLLEIGLLGTSDDSEELDLELRLG